MLGDANRCNVMPYTGTRCGIKRCKCKPTFALFYDDGSPHMSRLRYYSCNKHLSILVNRVWIKNNEVKKYLEEKRQQYRKEELKVTLPQ